MYFRAIKHLLDVLTPFSTENGGPLKLEHVVFVEGRGNLIIEYAPEGASGMPQPDSGVLNLTLINIYNRYHCICGLSS